MPIGFHDGFDWLAQRYTDEQHELTIDEVSRAHLTGGVMLGSSRRDVTSDAALMHNTVAALAQADDRRARVRLAATTWCAARPRSNDAAS